MFRSFQDTESDLVVELGAQGLEMTPKAMGPLRDVDFSRLVGIYDHEERFLHEVFVSSLLEARQARLATEERSTDKINAHDVRAAMLMLGHAVSEAHEQTFSQANKSVIQEICPFCT